MALLSHSSPASSYLPRKNRVKPRCHWKEEEEEEEEECVNNKH